MDRDFIKLIYKEYYDLIKLIVKNTIHTSNSDDITSCVHDVFMIAMKKESLENHANIKAWLLKTTKNVVKTFNRQRAIKNKYYDFVADFKNTEPAAPDFSELLLDKINAERFKDINADEIIMEALTKNEQDFYTLLRFNKLKIKEIAEILNISEGAAATRSTRLKEKIKKIISRIGGDIND